MSAASKNPKYFTNIQYPYADTWDAKTRSHVTFTLANIHYSLANAIRRAMISKVDTIGFNSKFGGIKIEKNDTYLNNQIISHRISMIPLNIPNPDKFDTEEYLFMLEAINDTNAVKLVTTEDFKVKRISSNTFLSDKETRAIFPPDPITKCFTPIVKLKPKYHTNIGGHDSGTSQAIGQAIRIPVTEPVTIKLSAKAIRANGDENGHFSPVTISAYGNTIDTTKAPQAEQEFIDSQNAIVRANGLSDIPEDKLKRRFKINQIQRVFIVDESGEPVSFDFRVESVGVIPPLICVERALRWLVDDITRLITNLQSGNDKEVKIKPLPHLGNGFEITVEGEDDTLGNVIQSWIIKKYADFTLEPEERRLATITYHKTHPLERRIVFTIKPIDSADYMTVVQGTFKEGCESLIKHIESILAELLGTGQYLTELKQIV